MRVVVIPPGMTGADAVAAGLLRSKRREHRYRTAVESATRQAKKNAAAMKGTRRAKRSR